MQRYLRLAKFIDLDNDRLINVTQRSNIKEKCLIENSEIKD